MTIGRGWLSKLTVASCYAELPVGALHHRWLTPTTRGGGVSRAPFCGPPCATNGYRRHRYKNKKLCRWIASGWYWLTVRPFTETHDARLQYLVQRSEEHTSELQSLMRI